MPQDTAAAIERPFTDLTQEEIDALVYFRRAQQEAEAKLAEQEPASESAEVKPEAERPYWFSERFIPWDMRAAQWLVWTLGLGTRDGIRDESGKRLWLIRQALVWWPMQWIQLRHMLWVVRSGKVAPQVFGERWGVCMDCPQLKLDRKGYHRCGACNCIDWILSRLERKNEYRINHCPIRRHPGEYVQLVRHKWPNRKTQQSPAPRGGCGGNGNG